MSSVTGAIIGQQLLWPFVPFYFLMATFLAGVGSTAFLISYFAERLGFKRGFTLKIMDLLSGPIVGISMIFLLWDLGLEEWPRSFYVTRAVYLFTSPNVTSVIAWGSWLIAIFIPAALVFASFDFSEALPWIPWGKLGWLRNLTRTVGVITAFGVAAYKGALLASIPTRPFLNNPLTPLLLIIFEFSAGLALGQLTGVFSVSRNVRKETQEEGRLLSAFRYITTILIVVEINVLFFYLLGSAYFSATVTAQAAQLLVVGEVSWLFWIVLVGSGLSLPLSIYLKTGSLRSNNINGDGRALKLTTIAGILLLIGVLVFTYLVIRAALLEPLPGVMVPVPEGWN